MRENFTGSVRQGSIRVAGRVLTIVQDAGLGDDCGYLISRTFNSHLASDGTGTITVTSEGALRVASSQQRRCCDDHFDERRHRQRDMSYTVGANPGQDGRKGAIMIAGQMFSVKQMGS